MGLAGSFRVGGNLLSLEYFLESDHKRVIR